MKFISKEIVNGKPVITMEAKFLCFKKLRRYQAELQLTQSYYSWVELPNMGMVGDTLSFQLDALNRNN